MPSAIPSNLGNTREWALIIVAGDGILHQIDTGEFLGLMELIHPRLSRVPARCRNLAAVAYEKGGRRSCQS
jgi:hypothetical protein